MTRALTAVMLCLLAVTLLIAPHSSAQRKTTKNADELSFVTRLSRGAKESDALPVLIAMHGLGDHPESFVRLFDDLPVRARVIAARAPDPWGDGFSWYPIDDPNNRNARIKRSASRVLDLARRVCRSARCLGKPVLTGFSQGGVLSFTIAATAPDAIAASLPIAGALDNEIAIQSGKSSPLVYAFHGMNDARISVRDAQGSIKRFREAGFTATLSTFENTGHTVSARMRTALFAALTEALTLASEEKR